MYSLDSIILLTPYNMMYLNVKYGYILIYFNMQKAIE